jgi:hypothetical protein
MVHRNTSLVVDLASLDLHSSSRLHPEAVCEILNRKLGNITPSKPQLAAIRWTAKGHLVVTGGPTATSTSLNNAALHISNILTSVLHLSTSPTPIPQPRANIRWSQISINGVPTGASTLGDPRSPQECHEALKAHNLLYTSLTVTQQPSWVRSPSSYDVGSISSLSLAFEDPDGGKLRALLAECYLYIFGTRASVKKWKLSQPWTYHFLIFSFSILSHWIPSPSILFPYVPYRSAAFHTFLLISRLRCYVSPSVAVIP